MPRVRLEPGGTELDVPAGERLLDVADDEAPLCFPVACRSGDCRTCAVQVLGGAARLAPPAPREQAGLDEIASPGVRLGCQLRMRADGKPGDTVILRLLSVPS